MAAEISPGAFVQMLAAKTSKGGEVINALGVGNPLSNCRRLKSCPLVLWPKYCGFMTHLKVWSSMMLKLVQQVSVLMGILCEKGHCIAPL